MAKRKSPAFSFYPDSWIGGTILLTPLQKAAYIELLCVQWITGPFSLESAKVVCRGIPEGDIETLIEQKFEERDGKYLNLRLEEERQKQLDFRERQAQNGRKGGRPKNPNETQTKPKPFQNENPNETQTITQTKPKNNPTDSDSDSVSVLDTDSGNSDSLIVSVETTKPTTLLTFPTAGNVKQWELDDRQVETWQVLYPGVDVLAECKMALAWVKANSMKTARGMPKFLVGWLNRANDSGRRNGQANGVYMTAQRRREANMAAERAKIKEMETNGQGGIFKLLGQQQ